MAEMTTVCYALLASTALYFIELVILAFELSQSSSHILTRNTSATADCVLYGARVIVASCVTLSAVVKLVIWQRHGRTVSWLSVVIIVGGVLLAIVEAVYLVLGPLNELITAGVVVSLVSSLFIVSLGIYIYKGPPGLGAAAESVRRASTQQRLTSSRSLPTPPNYGSINNTERSSTEVAVASGGRSPGHLQPQPQASPSANNSPPASRRQQEEEAEFTSPVRAAAEVLAATEEELAILAVAVRELRETAEALAVVITEAAAKAEAEEAAEAEAARETAEKAEVDVKAAEKAEAAKEAAAEAAEKAEAAKVEAAEVDAAEVEAAEVEAAKF